MGEAVIQSSNKVKLVEADISLNQLLIIPKRKRKNISKEQKQTLV